MTVPKAEYNRKRREHTFGSTHRIITQHTDTYGQRTASRVIPMRLPAIQIAHAECDACHVDFMYRPVVNALIAGFQPLNGSCATLLPPVKGEHGVARGLRGGDIFIWVGEKFMRQVPWRSLRSRNVTAIVYQSETVLGCAMTRKHVDEMWDFSWQSIDLCATSPDAPRLRYVPIGLDRASPRARQSRARSDAKLLFLGNPTARSACWATLKAQLGARLEPENSAWSAEAYKAFLQRADGGIYLNLHKGMPQLYRACKKKTAAVGGWEP